MAQSVSPAKPAILSDLKKQGYRFVGNHSAIKVCLWCKRAVKNEDVCYKNTFYGIQTHRCIQASVSMFNCFHRCKFCWRTLDYTLPYKVKDPDNPTFILDGFIKAQKKYLQGFKGNKKTGSKKFEEAMNPKHVALSLAGDATLYPLLPELIDEIYNRSMTSFVVTNGMVPSMLRRLLDHEPTQLYVTLPAPDEKTYLNVCNPLIKNGWSRLRESLELLQSFKRSTIRLTVYKGLNFHNIQGYADIIKDLKVKFIEVKAGMPVGYAQYRLAYEDMPRHNEIIEFSKKLGELSGLKIISEKENSRVALLMRKDFESRKLNF